MAFTQGNKKILDLKRWEFASPAPTATAAGRQVASSYFPRQQQLYVSGATEAWIYTPSEDGWVATPSPAFGAATTWGAGAATVGSIWSTGTTVGVSALVATGGTTTTLDTDQPLARDLRGYYVNILSGPNAGATLTIASNTVGTNATITFTTASPLPFDATNTYRLLTPVWYALATSTNAFKAYDFATNTWSILSTTGLPARATDSKLVATPSWYNGGYCGFGGGTASSATTNTLDDSTKTWTAGQWVGSQVRITGGTGAGQIRTITASTATGLTVGLNWTITPDNTSTYTIEGNDDFLYLAGNAAVTLFRYQISTNTWTTLTPAVARTATPGVGLSFNWVFGVTDSAWTNESAIINGRRIYSFRGGASALLDYYDIPSNTWVNGVTFSTATETFTAGTKYAYVGDFLYIQKDATGRWFRYTFPTSEMNGWSVMTYPQSTAVVGDTCFDVTYFDGASSVTYIYMILNTSTVMLRQMIF